MKRRMISNFILLIIAAYFIWLITQPTIYLSKISMEVKNPISLSWHYFTIDTKALGAKGSEDDYKISLYPFYFVFLCAFLIRFIPWKKK
ncbi:hypothetical protein [Macrococcus equi]|uniref:hypothetical protein n=1 Tax=Macrococcus equi TaxID=3395462 RepID=UPI0039BDC266